MTDTTVTYTVHDTPPPEAAIVDAGLGDANDAAAPLHEVRPACIARCTGGDVVGGAVGRTWGIACELQQLWVDPAHRRRGIGAELVREFERRALARGCRAFYLATFSFQAPSLYHSLGYSVRLELHGFGHGIVKYTMVREIEADTGRVGS